MFGSLLGAGFTALGATLALWLAAMARFMLPNALAEPRRKLVAGYPGDFRPGYVETRYRDQHGVWLVEAPYQGRMQIFALRAACTHLGCGTQWQPNERKFKCPCHGSGFRLDGTNIEGPAPRPLERVAIRVAENGQLEIDTSRVFRQELGQWSDPGSYVPR